MILILHKHIFLIIDCYIENMSDSTFEFGMPNLASDFNTKCKDARKLSIKRESGKHEPHREMLGRWIAILGSSEPQKKPEIHTRKWFFRLE